MGRKSTFNQKDADEIVEVYGLFDPRDGALRYIGKARCARKRLASHQRDSRRRDTPVYRWFRKLSALGCVPHVQVLERGADWPEIERRLIAQARARGERLLNVADGGDQPGCPPEVRSSNAERLNARLRDDDLLRLTRRLKREAPTIVAALTRLGDTEAVARFREKQRALYRCLPDHFPTWAAL